MTAIFPILFHEYGEMMAMQGKNKAMAYVMTVLLMSLLYYLEPQKSNP